MACDRVRRRYVEFDGGGETVREVDLPGPAGLGPPFLHRVVDEVGAERLYQVVVTGMPRSPTDGPYRGEGPDFVLGVHLDEQGIETLRRYRLVRD